MAGMEKRILITGITLATSIIVIIVVFFVQTSSKENINPIKTIPQDAALILKVNSFDLPSSLINKKYKIWEESKKFVTVQTLNHQIEVIDSLAKLFPELYSMLLESSFYISGHISGGKKMYFLSLFSISKGIKEKTLINIFQDPRFTSDFSSNSRKYEGKTIFAVKNKTNNNQHYIALINGLLAYSSSPILIENAIRQTALSSSLLDNESFIKVINTAGKNKGANLYIDFSQSNDYLSLFGSKNLSGQINNKSVFGNWTELDINLKDNLLLFNGFTLGNDSSNTFISTISSFEPVKIEADKILPASISTYISYSLSSPHGKYGRYKELFKEKGKLENYEANLKQMNKKYGVNFDDFFLKILDDEITYAYKEPSGNQDEAHYLLLKCRSGTEAEKALEDLNIKLEAYFNQGLKSKYSPDSEVDHMVYNIPIYPLFGRLLGDFYKRFEDNYLVVYKNYIVVSNTYKNLARFLYENMLQKTLSHDEIHQQFSSSLSIKSHLLAYTSLSRSSAFFKDILNEEIISDWKKHSKSFKKIQSAGIQISEVSNLPYINLIVNYQEDFRGKPRTVWESLMDTTTNFKPKFVTNHYTKQNEIVIQDNANNLYLINQSGRILWKVPIDGTINSDIYQIDFYKNGKLQLLFSTKNKLHLLDRNGNYIERYPIKLRETASTGMSLFDYDNNKNYRIFIPGTDKQVYAYTKDGSIINGFDFKGSDHIVHQPVQHFRVGEKDYIVVADENFTYILDRKGSERIKVKESIAKSANNTYHLFNTGVQETSFITTTSAKGELVKVYFNGNVEKKKIRDLTPEHFFDFKDINADGKQDIIILDGKVLYTYNLDGSKIFEKKLNDDFNLPPVYYHFSQNDRKIGLVSQKNQTIYLINNNGDIYKDFPLEGTTQFSIGYFDITSSRFNLIVGGRNNFLYNYSVE